MGPMGGGGGGDSTTTTKQVYSPEEEAARAKIFAEGGDIYNQQKPNAGTYQGPGVVGFSQPSQQAFGTQMGVANAATPTAYNALASADFNMGPGRYVSSNPYAADAIKAALDPIIRTHTTQIMPNLRTSGMASGTGMGTRQGVAEGLATDALYRTLGNTASSMASGMYNTGTNAAVTTQGQLPQIMAGAQMPATMQSQVGTALENQAQSQENLAAAQRLQAVNGPWQLLQNWGGLVGGMSNPTTQTTQTAPSGGAGGGGLGGIGSLISLIGLGSSLFSDRELKENIKQVGKLNDGQKIYLFNYKGDPTPRIGLIAQEVAEAWPMAVRRESNGYLSVDYAEATRLAASMEN